MTVSEIMKLHSVKVNNGSGVLVNAMSKKYTYIFTTIHVLDDEDSKNEVINCKGESLNILKINRHQKYSSDENYDCAVIQIEYLENINQFTLNTVSLEHNSNIAFAGYPSVESQTNIPFKQYNGSMASNTDNYLVATLDGSPSRENIEGMSGGGIYHIQGNYPYLVGVEYRMDNTPGEQQFSRIRCCGLNIYQEIINDQQLAPTVPPFLECFSRFQNDIFQFNVIEPQNIESLQNALLDIAKQLVSRGVPTPYELMEKYKNDLLISSENPEQFKEKELWIAYFEFLIICVLIDGVENADEAYVKSLERKRRILYCNSDRNWIGRLKEILIIARRVLDERGTLIIVSPEKDADMLPTDLQINRIIPNIATVPTSGPFIQIHNPQSTDIYKSFVLRHYAPLKKECVIRKEEDFAAITDVGMLLQYFRDSFNEIIK